MTSHSRRGEARPNRFHDSGAQLASLLTSLAGRSARQSKGKRMRFVSFRSATSVLATTALLLIATAPSHAQSRAETLRYVTGASVNTLDPNIPGATRESFGLSMSTYDRLVSFGRKQLMANGCSISTPSTVSLPNPTTSVPTN